MKSHSPLRLVEACSFGLILTVLATTPLELQLNSPKGQVQAEIVSRFYLPISSGHPFPELKAKSVFVYDLDSQTVLYQRNPDLPMYPASTTKIATALTALKYFQEGQVLTVQSADSTIGSSIHLSSGDQYTLEDILYGLLVSSGNDAALTIAENMPGGYNVFVDKMNQLASNLNLSNTHFTNVAGLINPAHYTTARDLTVLAAEATQSPLIRKIIATKNKTITNLSGTKKTYLETTNKLLGLDGVLGMKTGTAPESGECLVTFVERNNHKILITILNTTDRFTESKETIDWVFTNFSWVLI